MKKLVLIILFFLVIPFVMADWYYNSKELLINMGISSDIKIVPKSDDYSIKYIIANLSFFPLNSLGQEVLDINAKPEADIKDKSIEFRWENQVGELEFGVDSSIKTRSSYMKIGKKIEFPLAEIPEELEIYTNPSKTIDSDNRDIIRLASDLAKGENDLYVVVFKLADWTKKNIKYNLSTMTASVSQKASWVLENRQGVCDELTNLFIAMARSLGIPARFISGIAYTNSEDFAEEWGPHGWAEVYFPGYGWVPFDVTYGEFGFVDPTHIKMKESLDADEPSTNYQWLGHNINVITKELDIKTELKDKTGRTAPLLSLNVNILKDKIGFGSYNLIEARVKNLVNSYTSTALYLSKPREVEIIGDAEKTILLKPDEEKSIYWIAKLDSGLNKGYIYTFPISIGSLMDITEETSFSSSYDSPLFSYEEINSMIKQKEEEEEKAYSRNVGLNCTIKKEEFYVYENNSVSCYIKNTGNVFLKGLSVCLSSLCRKIDLGISQAEMVNFSLNAGKYGKQEIGIKAYNSEVSKLSSVGFSYFDTPKLEIEELEYPRNASFEGKYAVSFYLKKGSVSDPKNIDIILNQNGLKKEWNIDKLTNDKKLVLDLYGDDLGFGENRFSVLVKYYDNNGKEYSAEKAFYVMLGNTSFPQKLLILLKMTGRRIENTNLRESILFFVIACFIFLMVVLYVFKRGRR